jgi:hypothetical protein
VHAGGEVAAFFVREARRSKHKPVGRGAGGAERGKGKGANAGETTSRAGGTARTLQRRVGGRAVARRVAGGRAAAPQKVTHPAPSTHVHPAHPARAAGPLQRDEAEEDDVSAAPHQTLAPLCSRPFRFVCGWDDSSALPRANPHCAPAPLTSPRLGNLPLIAAPFPTARVNAPHPPFPSPAPKPPQLLIYRYAPTFTGRHMDGRREEADFEQTYIFPGPQGRARVAAI